MFLKKKKKKRGTKILSKNKDPIVFDVREYEFFPQFLSSASHFYLFRIHFFFLSLSLQLNTSEYT